MDKKPVNEVPDFLLVAITIMLLGAICYAVVTLYPLLEECTP